MPRSVLQRVHCSLDTIADTTYRMVWNGLVHPPVLLGKYRGIDRFYQRASTCHLECIATPHNPDLKSETNLLTH